MSKLRLPAMRAELATLIQRVGAGCVYPYQLAGEQGVLRLTLATGRQPGEMSGWMTDVGLLQFSDAQAVLSLMSRCPTFALPAENPEQMWYWPWWHQQLSNELLTLFGHIDLKQEQAETGELLLTLTLELSGQRTQSLLALSARSLSLLINKPGWHQDVWPLPESMTLSLPMIIGDLALSLAELRALRHGDILLPPRPCFTPEGRGTLQCANRLLHGEIHMQSSQMAHFILTEMERLNVTPTSDEFVNHPQSNRELETAEVEADFAPLPLFLSVRCGQLKLTLGELQQLAPGGMVMIDNVTPGEAILCHGDYPLAKGELVDVEGRLGLQITHMLPGSHNPLVR